MEEKDRKNYERKIVDLTKTNRQITHEVEMLRRKCNVVQEKYQNIRSLLSKDKGIGRPIKDFDELSNKDKKVRNNNMMEEINEMANQLDSLKIEKLRRGVSLVGDDVASMRLSKEFDKK